MRRICDITMTYNFIFRLVLYSHEGVSFNIIVQNILEGIKQLNLSFGFKKKRLETPFKCDNVKALIKTPIVKIGPVFLSESSENCSICYAFWVFSDQSLENIFGFPK